MASSYPEGYFGRNQLLDGSMSLSPLHSSLTSDLHVSTVRDPPSEFPLTSANSSIDHHLSGQSICTLLSTTQRDKPEGNGVVSILNTSYFRCAYTISIASACTYALLLGPCFKTGRSQPSFKSMLIEKTVF